MILRMPLRRRFVMLAAVALLAVLAPPAGAQTATDPDFNGRWELVEYSGDTGFARNDAFQKMVLEIQHESGQLKIRVTLSVRSRKQPGKRQSADFVFYTDGRGENNLAVVDNWPRNGTYESVTKWKKDKLVTDFKEQRDVNSRSHRIDEWQLQSNSGQLVFTSVQRGNDVAVYMDSSPDSPSSGYGKRKFVFKKIA